MNTIRCDFRCKSFGLGAVVNIETLEATYLYKSDGPSNPLFVFVDHLFFT